MVLCGPFGRHRSYEHGAPHSFLQMASTDREKVR